jgi:hypothetical protein
MNVEQCWNETELLGEELMPIPLRLPQIPHTADMIMQIIQGNMTPSETAAVADDVKNIYFLSKRKTH